MAIDHASSARISYERRDIGFLSMISSIKLGPFYIYIYIYYRYMFHYFCGLKASKVFWKYEITALIVKSYSYLQAKTVDFKNLDSRCYPSALYYSTYETL